MKKLRVAIIGAGQIVWNSHLPNYLKLNEDVEVVGVCDVNGAQAQRTAKEFGLAQGFDSKEAMFDALEIDAVSVCVPNRFHYESVMYALEHGCHVLCEKPPGLHYEEARRMQECAASKGLLLTFNFHFRHGRDMQFLKREVLRGMLGDIYGARVQAIRRRGIPGWGNFINKEMQGGGPLIDIGIHMLDLTLYMMGFPKIDYVCGTTHQKIGTRKGVGLMGDWDPEKFTVEDAAFGFIRFQNGASLQLETAFALNVKERDIRNVQVFGDMAGASLFPLEIYGEKDGVLTDTGFPFMGEEDRHFNSVLNFVQACLGRETLVVKGEEGVVVQRVIDGLYESAETGQPVYFV